MAIVVKGIERDIILATGNGVVAFAVTTGIIDGIGTGGIGVGGGRLAIRGGALVIHACISAGVIATTGGTFPVACGVGPAEEEGQEGEEEQK